MNEHQRLKSLQRLVVVSFCCLYGAGSSFAGIVAERISGREAIEKSNLIVVAKIEHIQFGQPVIEIEGGLRVRPWKISVAVELVLKGEVAPYFDYEVYAVDPWAFRNGTLERPREGTRRILLLNRDDATIRAVKDVYPTSIGMRDALPDINAFHAAPVGERIARLFLTQASEEDDASFAGSIQQATSRAILAAGYEVTAKLLEDLARSSSKEISISACFADYEQLYGSGTCLDSVLKYADVSVSDEVLKLREWRSYIDAGGAESLRTGKPSSLVPTYTGGEEFKDTHNLREYLTYLSHNQDSILRAIGVRELNRRGWLIE